jgi:hypothetical protein
VLAQSCHNPRLHRHSEDSVDRAGRTTSVKAASVGGLAYRHIRYFIPLLISHRDRKALIAPVFPELAGNFSSMSPRGFEAPPSASLNVLPFVT